MYVGRRTYRSIALIGSDLSEKSFVNCESSISSEIGGSARFCESFRFKSEEGYVLRERTRDHLANTALRKNDSGIFFRGGGGGASDRDRMLGGISRRWKNGGGVRAGGGRKGSRVSAATGREDEIERPRAAFRERLRLDGNTHTGTRMRARARL